MLGKNNEHEMEALSAELCIGSVMAPVELE